MHLIAQDQAHLPHSAVSLVRREGLNAIFWVTAGESASPQQESMQKDLLAQLHLLKPAAVPQYASYNISRPPDTGQICANQF